MLSLPSFPHFTAFPSVRLPTDPQSPSNPVNVTQVPRKLRETNQRWNLLPPVFAVSLCPSLIPFELRPTGMHPNSIIAVIVLLLRRSVIFTRSKNLFPIKLISHQTCIKFYTQTDTLLYVKRYISKISALYINNNKIWYVEVTILLKKSYVFNFSVTF